MKWIGTVNEWTSSLAIVRCVNRCICVSLQCFIYELSHTYVMRTMPFDATNTTTRTNFRWFKQCEENERNVCMKKAASNHSQRIPFRYYRCWIWHSMNLITWFCLEFHINAIKMRFWTVQILNKCLTNFHSLWKKPMHWT